MMERIWPTFLEALAAREQPGTTLVSLQTLFRREVGAKLFTVMTFDPLTGQSQRVHSSHPEEYPVSGRKPLHLGLWSRTRHRGTQDVHRQYDRSDRRGLPGS